MDFVVQRDLSSTEYIKTVVCEDGYHLQYRCWPSSGTPAGTIVLVNGMMSHSGWFRELAQLLSTLGLVVVGADRRGSGLNQYDRGDAPSSRILVSDLRKIIANEDCGAPVYLVGWCWGALPVVNVALELGQDVRGLVLLAPGLFPSQQIKHVIRQQLFGSQHVHPHSPVLHSPLTAEMFSNRANVQDFIRKDDLAQRTFTSRFFQISAEMSLIACARLPQLTQCVLLLIAAQDETIDNDETLKIFRRLLRTKLTSATLDCHHGMQFEMPGEIAAQISQWIQGAV